MATARPGGGRASTYRCRAGRSGSDRDRRWRRSPGPRAAACSTDLDSDPRSSASESADGWVAARTDRISARIDARIFPAGVRRRADPHRPPVRLRPDCHGAAEADGRWRSAATAALNAPCTGRRRPSSDSSPINSARAMDFRALSRGREDAKGDGQVERAPRLWADQPVPD